MFSAAFTGFLRVRTAIKILGVLGVFLGVIEKNKEKKARVEAILSSVQTRCIVKGEAQKNPLFWRFSGGF